MTAPALHAKESGADGPVIVFLHGFGGSHEVWRGVAKRIGPAARIIAYDLPGHARSLATEGSTSSKAMAQAILADLAQRKAAPVHVVGHSMGGAIAALMGLAQPDQVASLTLLAPGGLGTEINAALLRRFARASSRKDVSACLAEMMATGHEPTAKSVHAMAAQRRIGGQSEALGRIVEYITRDGRQGTIPLAKLAGLRIPTAVAWGRLDPVLPVAQALRLPAAFDVRLIESAGHMLPEEAPGKVAKIIVDTVFTA
ncbi:MAG: alpha/beta fold hydrolase [Rhizobiaceae bacterium]|nr:alpha/beta fold hydrolase [Rhizobiaceae bacterium]